MPIHLCHGCPTEFRNGYKPCQTRQTTFTGAVLDTYERNMSDDSDFFAVVWDADAGRVRDIEYGTTRSWTYHNSAVKDATPDVRAAAMAWYREQWIESTVEYETRQALRPEVGRTVRSLTTKGKNVGAVGEVVWFGADQFRSTRHVTWYRVGIEVEGDSTRRFLNAEKVEVVDPKPADVADIRARAATIGEPVWAGVLRGLAMSAIRTADLALF